MIRGVLLALLGALTFSHVASAQPQSFDDAVARARAFTVKIKVTGTGKDSQPDNRFGTGVLLRSDGFIATASHVIGQNSEWMQGPDGLLKRLIEVRISDRYGELEPGWRKAEFIRDGASDVAIIWIKGNGFARAECQTLQSVRGTDIYRLGFAAKKDQADEKGGKTFVADLPQNFRASMISEQGISGGPAFDQSGKVLGLAVNRENDPRFASQSFTEFVRIEQALQLLPEHGSDRGCRLDSSPRAEDAAPIDITDGLTSDGGATITLQYPDRAVVIRPGTYILDGRNVRLKAKRLIIQGPVVIKSFDETRPVPPGQAGEPGIPGGQAGGDGQNGGPGLQGGTGRQGGPGRAGRASGSFLLDITEFAPAENATLTLIANGEHGGNGGSGGVGGPGGAGGAGRNRGGNIACAGSRSPGNGGPGGVGGTGGPGGPGGRGGDGGLIEFTATVADHLADRRLVLLAPGGRGGAGGAPGAGGSPGSGGAAGAGSHCGGGGQGGARGTPGVGGSQGATGVLGKYGDVRGL